MTARLEAIERAMVDAIAERDEAALGPERRDAWLADRGLEPQDRDAFAAQSDTSFRVYRAIVRRTLRSAILLELPRTARLLGERFERDVDDYLAKLPRSHYLRDLAFELFDAASPGWQADPALPPFASDLARHELSAYEIGSWIDDVGAPVADEELDLAMPVRTGGGARIYRYGYPVHELAEGATTLERRDTILLAYRDREHDVRYLSLTPLAAEIFDRLAARQPLGAAITGGCEARGVALDDAVLADVSALLADLADRGVLLGSATAPKT
jgi:hypothetical protein